MKRTIFEGTVNGEKFNSVQEYNERVAQLMETGEFVNASSNTRVVDMDDEVSNEYVQTTTQDVCNCNCNKEGLKELINAIENYDEELSLFPFWEEGEEYYLDRLVSESREQNLEELKDANRILGKCVNYIRDWVADMDENGKAEYLANVRDIINEIRNDSRYNARALDKINEARAAAEYEFEQTMKELDDEENILLAAKPVIEQFIDFYRGVEADVLCDLVESKKCKCNDEKCKCTGECECNRNRNDQKIFTNVIEKNPQNEFDLNKILEKIFGPNDYSNRPLF